MIVNTITRQNFLDMNNQYIDRLIVSEQKDFRELQSFNVPKKIAMSKLLDF